MEPAEPALRGRPCQHCTRPPCASMIKRRWNGPSNRAFVEFRKKRWFEGAEKYRRRLIDDVVRRSIVALTHRRAWRIIRGHQRKITPTRRANPNRNGARRRCFGARYLGLWC